VALRSRGTPRLRFPSLWLAAVERPRKTLADSSPHVRARSAATILRITRSHDAALAVLAAGMASDDRNFRRDASVAVTGKAGATLVAALARLLQDDDDAVRFSALQAIGTLGPVPATLPALSVQRKRKEL
jgi:HEAT repeat protein